MKGRLALSILMGFSAATFAETMGSGGGSFMFDGTEAPARPAPARTTPRNDVIASPLPPPRPPMDIRPPQAAPVVPEQRPAAAAVPAPATFLTKLRSPSAARAVLSRSHTQTRATLRLKYMSISKRKACASILPTARNPWNRGSRPAVV